MNKRSLKFKLLLAFVCLSLIVLVIGLSGYRSVGQLGGKIELLGNNELPGVEAVLRIEYHLSKLGRSVQELMDPNADVERRKRSKEVIAACRSVYLEQIERYDQLEMSSEARSYYEKFLDRVEPWKQANYRIVELSEELIEIGILNPERELAYLEGFKEFHFRKLAEAMAHADARTKFEDEASAADSGVRAWLENYDGDNAVYLKAIENSAPTYKAYHESLAKVRSLLDSGNSLAVRREIQKNLLGLTKELVGHFDEIIVEIDRAKAIYREMSRISIEEVAVLEKENMKYLDELVAVRVRDSEETVVRSVSGAQATQSLSLIFTFAAVIGAISFGMIFGARLTKRLNLISTLVDQSAKETKMASEQVAEASSTLASGASEQAASLEETSSAIEEMTSMVTRDAELAGTTAQQALDADAAVKAGVSSMRKLRGGADAAGSSAKELSRAMDGIKSSSDSISKIIKNIDEIAFQTNILALNAAVEAARAGEAGAGFAVVADEVRSLAHRAAVAAQETQGLIGDSIRRSDEGVRANADVNERLNEVLQLASEVDGELQGIVTNVGGVDQSMGELRSFLDEQQNGISQINAGVVEINDVVQSNAAGAEEAASAAEELTAQANALVEVVNDLSDLVNGHGKSHASFDGLQSGDSGSHPLNQLKLGA